MTRFEDQLSGLRRIAVLAWFGTGRAAKWGLASVLLMVLVTSALTALAPVALAMAIDRFNGVQTLLPLSPLALLAGYALIHWLVRIIGQLRDLVFARTDRRVSRVLSAQVFDHIMRLPSRFHLERKTGAVSHAVSNGLQGFQLFSQQLLFTVIPVLLELSVVAVVLSHLQQPFFLGLLLVTMLCHALLFARGAVLVARPAREASAAQGEASAAMTDGLLNYEVVKCFGCEALLLRRYDDALASAERGWRRFFQIRATNGVAVATVFGVFLASGSLYAGWRTQQGLMSIGDMVLVISYLFQIVRPAELVGMAMQQFSQSFAFLEKLFELLRQTPEPQVVGRELSAGEGEVIFEEVSVAYRADHPVLRDISFRVAAGATLGVVGISGAGKSTLMKLLMRLIEPDSGRILIDSIAIGEISLSELRRSISVVPQDTVLFDDTIAYNIAVGCPDSSQEQIEHAAHLAHLHEFVMSLPERYATRVGERGVKLSGGEKQRIAIARAALKQPKIYVFDEATSSLDSATERVILENFQEIAGSSTTVVIAHRLSTVMHADEIIVMDQGTIVERGRHAELLQLDGRYAALWHAQHSRLGRQPQQVLAHVSS